MNSSKKKETTKTSNHAREFQYRPLAERSFDLVMAQDMERKIIYVNHIWIATLGYSVEECLGRPSTDFVASKYHAAAKERNQKRIAGEVATFNYEIELIAKDGESIPAEIHSSPLLSENGEILEILIVARDLRERKKTQAALIESEKRYQGLFESAPIAIWAEDFSDVKSYLNELEANGITDFEDYFKENPQTLFECIKRVKLTEVNQTAVKLHRAKNKEELLTAGLSHIFSNETIDVFQDGLVALLKGEHEYKTKTTAKRLDGSLFYQSVHWRVLDDQQNDDWGRVIVSTQNISDLNHAEEQLKQQLNELNVLQATAFTCAQAPNIDALIRQITNIIGNTLYPDIYGVFLANEKERTLSPHNSYNILPHTVDEGDAFPFSHGLTGKAAREKKSIREDNVNQNKDYILSSPSIKSELCVPVKVLDKILGVINVESVKPAFFTEADERLLGTIASQMATAMQKLASLETEKKRRQIAETLQRISAALTTTLDQERAIELILNELSSVIEFTSASVQLLRGNYLEIVGGRGELVLEIEKDRIFPYPGENPNTIVLRDLKPYIINDAQSTYADFRDMPSIKSWLGVPLITNKQPLGLLTLDSDKPAHFTPEDAELVTSFANHAAISLENAQLFHAEQKRRREAETLRETALALTESLDLDSTIQQILEQLARVLPYDSAAVQIIEKNHVVNIGGRGWIDPEAVMNIRFPIEGDNPNSKIIREKTIVILKDARNEHAPFNQYPHNYIRSWMGIPMIIREEVVGILTVDSKNIAHFDEASAKTAEVFATQAAIAIENARLFNEERKRLEEAETLREAAITINSALSLDVVLQTVAKQMSNTIQSAGCAISSWNREKDMVVTLVDHSRAYPEKSDSHGAEYFLKDYPVSRKALENQEIILLQANDPNINAAELQLLHEQEYSILLMLPLVAGKKTIGLVEVYEEDNEVRETYTDEEIRLVQGLASHAAIAVENARLYDAEQIRRQEAETLRQAAHTISSSLNLDEVLTTIFSSIRRVIPFYSASVMLLKEDEQIEIASGYNLPEQGKHIGSVFSTENDALLKRIIAEKHPIILKDAQNDPSFGQWGKTTYVHGWMGIPLIVRGEVIGYITLDNKEKDAYQQKHAELAQVFAHQAASAIANARLYAEAIQTAERRAVLHRVSQDISRGIQSPEKTYHAIYQATAELMQCDAFVLSLRNDSNPDHDFAVYLVDKGQVYPPKLAKRSNSIVTLAEKRNGSVIAQDIDKNTILAGNGHRFGSDEKARSILISPMYIGEKLLGAISAQSYQPREYSKEEVVLLEMLAAHAAAALENSRLLEQAEQRGREFAELYKISQDLVTNQDTNRVLTAMLERATRLIGVSAADIYTYDEKSNTLTPTNFYGLNKEEATILSQKRLKISEGLAGKVARDLKPMRIDNYAEWPERSAQYDELRFSSVLELPLVYHGNLLGVLALFEIAPNVHQFTEDEERIMTLFAAQLSSALHSAKQLEQITTRLAELEAINNLSMALRTAETPEEMLPILIKEINRSLRVAVSVVWLLDPHSNQVYKAIEQGWIANIQPSRQETTEGIIGQVFTEGKPYKTKDIATDSHIKSNSVDLIPENWSGLWVPVRASRTIAGVIGIMAENPRDFDSSDLQILNIMAEIAGNAFQRARLHIRTDQQLKRLTALRNIDISISAHADLHITLQMLVEQSIKQLDVDAANILLVEKTTKNLKYFVGSGFKDPGTKLLQLRPGEGLPGKAMRERKILHSSALTTEGSTKRRNWFDEEDFHCYYCIPLNAKGNILGVMEVFKKTHINTPPEWMDFLEALAGQAAIAIDNHDLVEDLKRSNEELARAYDTTLEGWGKALELRDKETQGHTLNVTELTLQLASYMGMPEHELINVYRGALLHDIGKMGIPDNILHKPGPLTKEEWKIMRQHPQFAYNMLSSIPYLHASIDIPYSHHERWDGTGYPKGLKGEEIPLAARIFSVIDVWDALLTDRPYRDAWPQQVVIDYIRNESGTRFDPEIVEIFIAMIQETEG